MDAEPQPADAYPISDDTTLAELSAFGAERGVAAGEELLRAGRRTDGFYVVLEGEVEVVRPDVGGGDGWPRMNSTREPS